MKKTGKRRGRPLKFSGAALDRRVTVRITAAERHALMAHALQDKAAVSDIIRDRLTDLLTI